MKKQQNGLNVMFKTELNKYKLFINRFVRGTHPTTNWFNWIIIFTLIWHVSGTAWDFWSHMNNRPESFFTPSHLMLYTGFMAAGAVMLVAYLSKDLTIPAGYEYAFIGAILFFLGGFGDGLWHELIGIEVDFEALISPTHLMLAIGAGLLLSAPLRAAWHKPSEETTTNWVNLGPMLLSAGLFLTVITLFTNFAHLFFNLEPIRTLASQN